MKRIEMSLIIMTIVAITLAIVMIIKIVHTETELRNFLTEINNTTFNLTESPDKIIYTFISFDSFENNITAVSEKIVESHEYVKGRYDCTQFSKELVKQLKLINISSQCVSGFIWDYDDNGKQYRKILHTWVEVNNSGKIIPVEATGGYVINPERYSKKYVAINRGLCA